MNLNLKEKRLLALLANQNGENYSYTIKENLVYFSETPKYVQLDNLYISNKQEKFLAFQFT